MRTFFLILLFPLLASCQALTAVTSVVGSSVACNREEKNQVLPEVGSKKLISLSFKLKDGGKIIEFSEDAVCDYQGSMCGGGSWFEVWYGDQSISHEISLPSGDMLVFRPHNFCIYMNEFTKECKSGNCDPVDHFKLNLLLSEDRVQKAREGKMNWTLASLQDSVSVTGRELPKYGYQVIQFEIGVSDENL